MDGFIGDGDGATATLTGVDDSSEDADVCIAGVMETLTFDDVLTEGIGACTEGWIETLIGDDAPTEGVDGSGSAIETLTCGDETPLPPILFSETTYPNMTLFRLVMLEKPRALVLTCSCAEPPAGMVIEVGGVAMDMSPVFKPIVNGDESGGSNERLPTATEPGGADNTGGVIITIEATDDISD